MIPSVAGVDSSMETSKSVKKAVLISVISAVVSVFATFATRKVLTAVTSRRLRAQKDSNLTAALEDSMDCSDPVAKF